MAKTKTKRPSRAKTKERDKANDGNKARAKNETPASSVVQRVRELAPAVLVCALVLFQGGYYPGATCVIGLVSSIAFVVLTIVQRDIRVGGVLQPATFVFAIAVLLLVSSIVHGATATMLLESASWFAVAGMALWCVQGSVQSRARMLDAVAVSGAGLSVLGILIFAGIVPFEGGVSAGRLMFTFQYANAAGLFFAVVAVLCLVSSKARYRYLAVLSVAALLMTRSAGALGVFAVAAVALGVRFVLVEKPDTRLVAGGAAVVVVLVVASVFVIQGRLQQAAQTFIERIVQMLDGLSVFGENVLFGIGPDCWQFEYAIHQTAQYRASSVHCSYVQMALDGGFLAALVLVAMIVMGLVGLMRRRDFPSIVCALMVAVHAMVDFDLQFSSVVLLLAMLLAVPHEPANFDSLDKSGNRTSEVPRLRAFDAERKPQTRWETVLSWVIVLCSVFACASGVYLDMRAGAVKSACARGDVADACALADETFYLSGDPAVEVQLISESFAQGDFARVLDLTEGHSYGYAAAGLYRALSLNELGRADESLAAFESTLHDFPYDPELFDAVRSYIEERHLGDVFAVIYDEQASRANALASEGHAAWLSDQKTVDLIE